MLKEEAMLKIKEQLKRLMTFSVDAETPVEKKMTSIKLKDGTEISYVDGSELGIGVEVYKIDEDGNQTPIEDGDYDLEDGRIITIKDGGVEVIAEAPDGAGVEETPITSEKDKAKLEEPKLEEPKLEEPKKVEVEVEEGADMEARISAIEENISSMMEAISTMGHMQEMSMSKIKAIESSPAASSIKVGKTTSNGNFNSNKLEIDELRELRNKYKLNTNGDYNFSAK